MFGGRTLGEAEIRKTEFVCLPSLLGATFRVGGGAHWITPRRVRRWYDRYVVSLIARICHGTRPFGLRKGDRIGELVAETEFPLFPQMDGARVRDILFSVFFFFSGPCGWSTDGGTR